MNIFQPLGARCLVKPIPKPPLSETIITPDASKGKSDEGTIVALGTEPFGHNKARDPNAGTLIQLKVGDIVLFQQYTGSEFRIGGVDYRVLAYDDLLGIIHKVPDPEPKVIDPPRQADQNGNKILTPQKPERKLIVSLEEAADGL